MIKALLYDEIVKLALKEDIGTGDITTASTIAPQTHIEGEFIAKESGIICGLFVAARVFELVDPSIVFQPAPGGEEGYAAKAGEVVARVSGSARNILTAERTALNLMQHMCGVATMAARYREMVAGCGVSIADTRKTMPGLRVLEKYAVKAGGCSNHRFNLSDGVLIKDNHIKAAGSIAAAVDMARRYAPFVLKIEVECEDMDMVREAVAAGADIIMLDNMELDAMREAVDYIAGRAIVEASGNMAKRDIREVARTGVDVISIGALTHSVEALDISLKFISQN